MPDKLILVGRVAGAFGVKGEARISAYTSQPQALLAYRNLKRQDGSPALTLLSGRAAREGELVVRAKEITTREEAEALKGLKLFVPREALPEPEDEEFYLADLIGLEVVKADGTVLGKVKAVHDFGAGDLLEIDPGQGAATWLLPFTREAAPVVDVAGGRIVAEPPPEAP
jgi:16S rRNA processing protein RimM